MRRLRVFAGDLRGGMTLLEVLIGIFVLTVGLLGILTLFPVSIDSVGTMMKRTNAAQVASSAAVSLQKGAIKLYNDDYSNNWGRVRNAVSNYCIESSNCSNKVLYNAFEDWPDAISQAAFGSNNFQIPRDLAVDATMHDGNVVTAEWAPDGYGWTASFVPMDTVINRRTRYRVQIAVWRRYRVATFKADDGCTGDTFKLQSDQSETLLPGDFICDLSGIWHKIESVDGVTVKTITTPAASAMPAKDADILTAGRWWLIALYDTNVYPLNRE